MSYAVHNIHLDIWLILYCACAVNGRDKVICVNKMEANEVANKVSTLAYPTCNQLVDPCKDHSLTLHSCSGPAAP
jgi:hypothetical protein